MAKRRRAGSARSRKKTCGPHWGALFAGFGAGITIALFVWIYGLPELRRSNVAAETIATIPEARAQTEPASETPEIVVKPLEVTGAEYDFYELLTDDQVDVPATETLGPRRPLTEISEPGTYIIQAGAFQNRDDADSMRARVTMLIMPVQTQIAQVRDQKFHRVIIGPVNSPDQVNDYRRRLAADNIEHQVRKRAE